MVIISSAVKSFTGPLSFCHIIPTSRLYAALMSRSSFHRLSIAPLMRCVLVGTSTCARSREATTSTSLQHGGLVWCQTDGSLSSPSVDGPTSHQPCSQCTILTPGGRLGEGWWRVIPSFEPCFLSGLGPMNEQEIHVFEQVACSLLQLCACSSVCVGNSHKTTHN